MRKYCWAVLCLLLILFLLMPTAVTAEDAPAIDPPTADSADGEETPPASEETPEPPIADLSGTDTLLFYCLDTETVLRTKNETASVYPGTAVKLMTALVAFEAADDLTETVTVTSEMLSGVGGNRYGFKTGDTVSYEDLIKTLLLRKSNDAAQILAISLFGSTLTCVEAMNARAASLGMTKTHFTNVSGLQDAQMTTTASDLLPLALAFHSNAKLLEWSGAGNLRCESMGVTVYNNNYFLSRYYNGTGKDYLYSAVSGMINGSTEEAGDVLITSAKANGYTYIVILLGGKKDGELPTCYQTTRDLLEKDSLNFAYTKVLRNADVICELPIALGEGVDYAAVYAAETLEYYLPKDLDLTKLTREYSLTVSSLEAPVEEGMTVGSIKVYYDGTLLGETELIIRTAVPRSGTGYWFSRAVAFLSSAAFIRTAIIVTVLLIVYFVLNAIYRDYVKKKYHTQMK